MKKMISLAILATLVAPCMALAATIHVIANPISNPAGVVRWTLFDSQQAFEHDGEPVKHGNLPPAVTEQFDIEVPAGTYALTIYDDVNSNGKIDRTWVGFPTEAFGISNVTEVLWHPPQWANVKFEVTEDHPVTLPILMKMQ